MTTADPRIASVAAEPVTSAADGDALLGTTILTDDGRQNPYPAYEAMRRGLGRWCSATGATVLTRYGDAMEVMRDPRLGRPTDDMDTPSVVGAKPSRAFPQTKSMLLLNPPDHTRIRSLVSRAFTPKRVESLRPAIESILDPLLDEFALNGGGDLIAEIASQFPITVISELLGVPRSMALEVQPLVRSITAFIDSAASPEDLALAEQAAAELSVIFDELIEAKRKAPDQHLLSALIAAEEEGDRLSHEELIVNTVLLYSAGFETTTNLIGNGTLLLLDNPGQLQRLRDDATLIGPAIWEMLRADSPVQFNVRAALEPVELFAESDGGAQRFERGAFFIILLGSGNHDETVYDDPARFDVARFGRSDTPVPLSFGFGSHHCPGSHLARAEGEIFFSRFLDRFGRIALDETTLGCPGPKFRPSFTLRGLESLPLNVET